MSAPPPHPSLENFRALRRELRRRGFYEKDPWGVLSILAIHVSLFVIGLYAFLISQTWSLSVMATVVWGYGLTGIASNTHSSSHYATSKRRWVNRLLTYLGYPVITGFSATYWWRKHIVLHHQHPNVVGHDVDIDWTPLFAVTEYDRQHASPWARWFYSIQAPLIPAAIALNMTYGQWCSLRFLSQHLFSRTKRNASHWVDAFCLMLHVGLWISAPCLWFTWREVLGFYLLRNTVLGYTFFLLNAPSHYPTEACCLPEPNKSDFLYRQTATTLNYKVGWIGRLLCSGVEYQIEHHLCPGVCHTRLPAASRFIKAFCQQQGYPYRTLGWSEALVKAVGVFYFPKPVVAKEQPSPLTNTR